MDEITLLVAASCIVLAVLVYIMWKAAAKPEWRDLSRSEKREWRSEEERLKGKGAS